MKSGKPIHPSNGVGTAPDAATDPGGSLINFNIGPGNGASTMFVVITNLEAAQYLEVSFANGKEHAWFQIAPATTIQLPAVCHNCRLRGKSGATAAYSIMGIVA